MYLILVVAVIGADCVTCLVESGKALFLGRHLMGLLLRSGNDLDGRLLDLLHGDGFLVFPGCQQARLIHQVFQISTGKAYRRFRNGGKINVRTHALGLGVYFQNLLSALDIRIAHHDLAVESARTQQRRVEDVTAVGGGDNDDVILSGKAVHFHQQLVQRLLPFVVSAADACATVTAYSVDLVNEDDRRCIFLCLVEQITDTGCTHAHEHFYKVRTGDREERAACLAGNGSGKQCFTSTRRPHQQDTLRDACAQFSVLPGILQEVHDLFQLVLFLIRTGNIGESRLSGVRLVLDVRLAERGILAAAVCLPHHEHKQEDHQHQQYQRRDQRQQPGGVTDLVIVHLQRLIRMLFIVVLAIGLRILAEHGNIGDIIGELVAVFQGQFQFAGTQIQRVSGDLIVVEVLHDIGILRLLAAAFHAGQQKDQRTDQHNKNEQIRSDPTAFLWCQIKFTPFC